MKEEFLHYIWKYKKFRSRQGNADSSLTTAEGAPLEILKPGNHNFLAGPDFIDSRLRLDGQLWAGNVEIHIKSSDWYAHNHEQDKAYDNVILHVVWEHDMEVYGCGDLPLPTLVLSDLVSPGALKAYLKLMDQKTKYFINCEKDFAAMPGEQLQGWLERLYMERLERKVAEIDQLLLKTDQDYEAVLFRMLARNFGTKINRAAFSELAGALPFQLIRKVALQSGKLEILLLGFSNLLPGKSEEVEVDLWKKEYTFLKKKYDLAEGIHHSIQFFRLRPSNFPTIRISQLSRLYEREQDLFSKVISLWDRNAFHTLFRLNTGDYWESHYNFNKTHSRRSKKVSTDFVDLLLINTILPLKFAYSRSRGLDVEEKLFELITSIPAERNSITDGFNQLRPLTGDALNSQALIQLKTEYCKPNRCLNCAVGNYLISNSSADSSL